MLDLSQPSKPTIEDLERIALNSPAIYYALRMHNVRGVPLETCLIMLALFQAEKIKHMETSMLEYAKTQDYKTLLEHFQRKLGLAEAALLERQMNEINNFPQRK